MSEINKQRLKRRRSFTLKFKLAVLNHLGKTNEVRKTARVYKINRSSVRQWRSDRVKIESTAYKRMKLFLKKIILLKVKNF